MAFDVVESMIDEADGLNVRENRPDGAVEVLFLIHI